MPAQDSHAVGCSAASWRAPDGAPQGLEQERALAHRRCCTPAERMGPMRPRPEGVAEDRGRSAFAWRDGVADGEMLMPMTEAEADAYDRSEATAGNTLTYLTACGLSVAGSAQSALTFAGSGDMGAHSAPGSDKLLRLGSDGHAGERGVLRPGSARRRIGPELEARACEGLPGAPASERAGVQGPASGLVGAACSMHGHMHFGAPWVPTLPAGAPAGADASEAAAGLCLGSPADEALLAGLFGDPEGYGAGFAGAPAQPLAVPSRSAPGCLARAFLACGDPANLGYDPNPNPLDHAAAPAPLELAHGVPGSLPILSACGPWPGLGLGPRSASGIPAGIRGILPLGYAGGAAPEGARRGLAGAPLGLLSLGLSGPALATPELRQSELQLSLGMGLGLQLDLGAWHYGPGEGAGPQGTLLQAPPGGASNGRGAPAVGLWGAMLEGARQAGAGRFPGFGGRPHGFPGGLPKCEPDANDQVRCRRKTAPARKLALCACVTCRSRAGRPPIFLWGVVPMTYASWCAGTESHAALASAKPQSRKMVWEWDRCLPFSGAAMSSKAPRRNLRVSSMSTAPASPPRYCRT